MKGRKRIKRTTLLIIGAILLWSAVAIWNEVQRSEPGLTSSRSTTASKTTTTTTPKNSHTAIYPDANSLKMGTP
jgi:hypothetical protein